MKRDRIAFWREEKHGWKSARTRERQRLLGRRRGRLLRERRVRRKTEWLPWRESAIARRRADGPRVSRRDGTRSRRGPYTPMMLYPESTWRTSPVIADDIGEARKSAAFPISSNSTLRRSGALSA